MILKNGKPEHAVSKPTQQRSAPRRRLQALAKPTVASSLFKSRGLNPVHLNQVSKEDDNNSNVREEDNEFHKVKVDEALNTWKSAEKHRPKKHGYESYQNGYQYKPGHDHESQERHYQHNYGFESLSKTTMKGIRNIDTPSSSSDNDAIRSLKTKYKVRKKPVISTPWSKILQSPKNSPLIPSKPQQILITKKQSLNAKADVKERTKDLRLKGSDLYVARLGTCQTTTPLQSTTKRHASAKSPPTPLPASKSEPASLYDELSPLSRMPSPSTTPVNPLMIKPEARASRPCYRCVSAMHAVGIKRVFWTNANGEWEGAKVRDLVEALEKGIEGDVDGPGTGQDNKGVFVTKHEVLMLKRIMGF